MGMIQSRTRIRASRFAILWAAVGFACGVAPATGGTTRVCPAVDKGSLCFQQCGDASAPTCAVADEEGAALPECGRDGRTGAYLRFEDRYVVPVGASRCFVVLADDGQTADPFDNLPPDCRSFGMLVVDGAGVEFAPKDCFDFSCALDESGDCS